MTKHTYKVIFYLLLSLKVFGQTKTSIGSGNWGSASTWSPSGVPTATNDVIISDGHNVSINVNSSCKSIKIGNGGTAAELRYTGNVGLILNVSTNVTVSPNGTFRPRTSSNANHTMTISGNIVNNGIFDFSRDANSTTAIIFNKNGSQTISGTGTTNDYNNIIVDMGTSNSNILDIQSSNFTSSSNFLTLRNGTLKFSTTNSISVVPYSVAATIPRTAGLWVNSTKAIVTTSASITLSGNISVSAGSLSIGDATNEDLTSNGGTVSVSGGTVNIAGKYNSSSVASSFSLSGGFINVTTIGSSNTTIAPFHQSITGSRFDMTGGLLTIIREGGTGAQDLGFFNTGSTLGTVNGGTLQLGKTGTPASQTISINSIYPLPNLVVASASVTAKLLTNSLTVANSIVISSGTLHSNNLDLSLGANWNNSGTFIPGTSSVKFISNSAQSIVKAGGETFNTIQFSGSGIKTFSSAITVASNFSITSGALVDVSSSNFQLTVKGNFINDGTFNANKALVLLNGVSSQTIGGASTTNFYDLTLNNSAGLILTNNENLINTLTLSNGTFNTNSKVFTMVSTSTNTARIAQISGTGDIIGNVTAQRFAPGGSTGWAFIGSPISSASTFSQWDDNLFISCPTCPDGYVPNFTSIYSYIESAVGSYSSSNSYSPIGGIGDAIVAGKGYWVYVGTGPSTTSDIILDMVGTVRKNNFTIPLTYNNSGIPGDDGWNLICNPYPSPISWTALKGATPNIDNAIYVYNADLNSGTGGTASYINGISSPIVSSGGIGDNIPMFQGFYVHSTGATSLAAQESNKVSSNQNFLKSSSLSSSTPLLRLSLKGPYQFNDETVLYTEQGATNGFDQQFDAIKFASQNVYAPTIALENGTNIFQINGVAPIIGTYSSNLKVRTGYSDTYTIQITAKEDFPQGTCIGLYDRLLNTTIDLTQNQYVFNLQDTTSISRFILTITINQLNVSSSVNQPSCTQPNSGMIAAQAIGNGPWNYYWKLNGQAYKTSLNKSSSDTIEQLHNGNYELQVNSVGQCNNYTNNYMIQDITIPTSSFTAIDTLNLSLSDSISIRNLSTNADSYIWDFGDSSNSNDFNPIKHYSHPGNYTITLKATSATNCTDLSLKILVVESQALEFTKHTKDKSDYLFKTLSEKQFELSKSFKQTELISCKLFNMNGQLVVDYGDLETKQLQLRLDLTNHSNGIYMLQISSNSENKCIKFLIK